MDNKIKKKIIYLLNENFEENIGIKNKVACQINALKKSFDVELININTNSRQRNFIAQYMLQFLFCIKLIFDFRIWRSDLIYHRMLIPDPALLMFFLFKNTVLEINGNLIEERNSHNWKKLTIKIGVRTVMLTANHIIFVSKELSNLTKKKSHTICGNRIDLGSRYQVSNIEQNDVVFVGSANSQSVWHGFDIISPFIKIMPHLHFHIFGIINDWEREELAGYDNLTFHGIVPEKEILAKINRKPVLAISSMAMQRAGIREASPLKSRFYLNHQIPVIGSYDDTDVENTDFYLKIERLDPQTVEDFISIDRNQEDWDELRRRLSYDHYYELVRGII